MISIFFTFITAVFFSSAHADVPGGIDLKSIDGRVLKAAQFKGKAILFVNVASKCGYTGQYADLQSLYEKYSPQGLEIIGVPCNQFGAQEPGTASEIQSFCKKNYGVKFPLLEKQDVNGDSKSELYKKLVDSPVGQGRKISWNFEKFLVGRDGKITNRFGSNVGPNSAELITAVEAVLAK